MRQRVATHAKAPKSKFFERGTSDCVEGNDGKFIRLVRGQLVSDGLILRRFWQPVRTFLFSGQVGMTAVRFPCSDRASLRSPSDKAIGLKLCYQIESVE